MYHLFKSVYVETDRAMLERSNHINFSTTTGFAFVNVDGARRYGEQLGFAKSIDDLTPEQFGDLMQKAFDYDSKLFIYCDSVSYSRLYSIFIKALFPNIDLETFKYFFLCLKSAYEIKRLRNMSKDLTVSDGVVIDLNVVIDLYNKEDPMVPKMQRVIMAKEKYLSLEWRTIRLITKGRLSNLIDVLNLLVDRAVIGYAKQSIEEWSHMVTDPKYWEYGGTDVDMLLHAESTASGCPLLGELGNSIFNTDFAYRAEFCDDWRLSVLDKCIDVYAKLDRQTHVKRMKKLRVFVEPSFIFDTPENCIMLLKALFNHERNQVQVTHDDATKYNASLIRYFLREDLVALEKLTEGTVW